MTVPFFLAPMAELSHRALRELIEDFGGCDCYFTEMISAGAFLAGGPFEAWYADAGPKPEKTVYQLTGADPQTLAEAASLLDKNECAGIDINMGCSAPAITRTGAGARWMESIDRAAAMIAGVRQKMRRRLSVKLRTGLTDDFEYLANFCRRLEQEGVELITLHPRTAREKFRRNCRWNYIPALRKELKIPVAGNGDIGSAEEMLLRGKDCDAVMTGRLAVRRPWIFAAARALEAGQTAAEPVTTAAEVKAVESSTVVTAAEVKAAEPGIAVTTAFLCQTGQRFLELLFKYQPPEFHISRARLFFHYFCDNLKWGNFLKNQLNREEELSGIEKVWVNYFMENNE